MNKITDFLPQYESEIQYMRSHPYTEIKRYPRTTKEGYPSGFQDLSFTKIDYETLLYILYCWSRQVNRLAEEEIIKGNLDNETFVHKFYEEADKICDFSVLDISGLPSGSPLVCIVRGYKRAKGLQ